MKSSSYVFKQIQSNSLKLRYKSTISSTTTINTNDHDKDITNELLNPTNQNPKEVSNEVKSASINTIIKNSFVKEDDIPWTGDEDIKTTVLRMLVDKYPPLKGKRESIKYNDASPPPSRRSPSFNKPPSFPAKISSNTYSSPIQSSSKLITDDQSGRNNNNNLRKEKMNKIRIKNQNRIMNAREAATDYFISKKFPEQKSESGDDSLDHQKSERISSRSIATWDSLVERRIQDAIAAGEFKNLPYHGKPLPLDPNENVNKMIIITHYISIKKN